MKLPELIQNIKSTLYNSRVPNTTLLDNRQIIYWINKQRALWLKREYNQLRSPQQNEKQVLNDIELKVYKNIVYPINIITHTLMRSKLKIPRTIQYNISDGVLGVFGKDRFDIVLNYTDRNSVIYKGNGVFNRKQIFVFKDNDYLWLKYANNLDKSRIVKNVVLEGVFENPLEVDEFNNTNDNIYEGIDEYPVSEAFLEYIEEGIYKINPNKFIKDEQANDEEG